MLEQSMKSEIHSFKKTSAYINYIYEVSKNDRPELYPKTPTKKVDQNSMDEWKNGIKAWNQMGDKVFRKKCHTTKLFLAAYKGFLSTYKIVASTLSDVNPKNNKGTTPLHIAAQNGQLKICEYICANTTDINPKNEHGETPFDLAKRNKHFSVCKMIMDTNILIDRNNYHAACQQILYQDFLLNQSNNEPQNFENDLTKFSNLWQNDKKKEMTSIQIKLCLIAAKGGFLDIYKEKVKNFADKNPSDENGITALQIATENGQTKIVEFILENIQINNSEIQSELTPFHMTAKKGTKIEAEGISKGVHNLLSPFDSGNIWSASKTDYEYLNEGYNLNFKGSQADSFSEPNLKNEAFQMELDVMLGEIDEIRENINLRRHNSKTDYFYLMRNNVLNPNAKEFQPRNSPTL